ncbi:MAG: hypothetical protein ACRC7O_11345 [Fimbriiglobus sp.]
MHPPGPLSNGIAPSVPTVAAFAAPADERFRNALLGTRWEPLVLWVADVP